MRIAFDFDNTLVVTPENGEPPPAPDDCPVRENALALARHHLAQGDEVVIYTARLGQDAVLIAAWAAKHLSPTVAVFVGKPRCDLYIDDRAVPAPPQPSEDDPRVELAIGFSGGLDSTVAYLYALRQGYTADQIRLVWMNLGQPYAAKEAQVIDELERVLKVKVQHFTMNLIGLQGKEPTLDDHIIPARNMVIASVLGSIAKRVWIVGTRHEMHPLRYDKNPAFYTQATLAMTQATGWATIVESPFAQMHKGEVIGWAVDHGYLDILRQTVSCWHPRMRHCGECQSCVQRYLYFLGAGVNTLVDFDGDPRRGSRPAVLLSRYLDAIDNNDFSRYHRDRIVGHFRSFVEATCLR